ncbi:single-stranded DNA-binding protein [Luteolibacter yonseiensis]|uniref:Single-stranded DNA-binding protein n=1 Tax=Luteolibacter yonseiensis TaxID=1144680 RepID=A0A934R230_9BACT|nr:uracil-DNA glycosylase family protein [Luteolibacter yonseiensis]MBK1815399.1 single-stranded DNA-binding protein [Luteolibacter yonseiensis]
MNELIPSTARLADELRELEFSPPVAYVYRTLDYTWEAHRMYLERFGKGKKRVVFLGMNPGPFGMAQTGVPFGEVAAVRDWMGIEAPVGKPAREHPKRPIEGFQCQRSEVSGRRLWGLFAERFGTADAFFKDHFVLNYCPLVWMSETGANLTPDKLSVAEMAPVEAACQKHLSEVISLLKPSWLIGVGGFAEERLRRAAESCGSKASIGRVLHPSPASPAANRGWAEAAGRQLAALGVWE